MQNLVAMNGDPVTNQNSRRLAKADPRQRAWLEVSPMAVEANARALRSVIGEQCLLMAVVKADGYGHGAVTVAKAALRGGADNLGVATLHEGIELRKAGMDCPILILGNLIDEKELEACFCWEIMPTLSTMREILICKRIVSNYRRNFSVQIKLNTGMTRLGCEVKEALNLIKFVDSVPYLDLQGVYSHLAWADGDKKRKSFDQSLLLTKKQQQSFNSFLRSLSSRRKNLCCHLANSAGTLRTSELHYDMVRIGLALYGYSPIEDSNFEVALQPALSVKARVTLVRDVEAGIGVSYGHNFVTKRKSRLAVVGIGYADGLSRALSGRISALFKGSFLPQVGSITMDQLVLDVTDQSDIQVGSVVTLLGEDRGKRISPQDWSDLLGSIPWEILCGFKNRLPRLLV